MTTLFKTVLEGMQNNNEINDASYSDWSGADHALEVYGENFDGEVDESEMDATKKALNEIIEAGGTDYYNEKAQAAIKAWNETVWGQDFGGNNGSEPFGG